MAERHRQAVANGMCMLCRNSPRTEDRVLCEDCLFNRTPEGRSLRKYVPIDEWLSEPRRRILRTLRRFDWLSAEELAELLGLPRGHRGGLCGNGRERNAMQSLLRRLVAQGLVERRVLSRSLPLEYRLARNIPESELEPPLDTEVIGEEVAA